MNWNAAVNKMTNYVVKIETPDGHGTGFLCFYTQDRKLCGIATARHVVSHADDWQQPMRLHHFPTQKTSFLKESDRVIFADADADSAFILIPTVKLDLPRDPISFLPPSDPLPVGTEVGWLGFPALAEHTLCFFSGNVSARQEGRHAYLIDGVAINGVSGGPVIHLADADAIQIIGTISAYVSNRATGDTLPGLSIARDVSHFHKVIGTMKTMEEAFVKKQQQLKEQQAQLEQPPATQKNEASPEAKPMRKPR